MLICGDPSCKLEVRDGEVAKEIFFLDKSTGRILSLKRHDKCAERYEVEGSNLRRVSADERKVLLSPASAMKNMLAARRQNGLVTK
jgi:hypothetical protein